MFRDIETNGYLCTENVQFCMAAKFDLVILEEAQEYFNAKKR